MGGSLKHPTPGGVPVEIMSPAFKVQKRDTKLTSCEVLKTSCDVFEFCISLPLTWQEMLKLCGSVKSIQESIIIGILTDHKFYPRYSMVKLLAIEQKHPYPVFLSSCFR